MILENNLHCPLILQLLKEQNAHTPDHHSKIILSIHFYACISLKQIFKQTCKITFCQGKFHNSTILKILISMHLPGREVA